MTPTILTKDGHVALIVGSPGGSRIITIAVEAIVNMIDHGMDVQQAIDAPRIHEQWLPDLIYLEPFALSADTRRLLEARGYTFADEAPWGIAEGIVTGAPTLLTGNADRGAGGAAVRHAAAAWRHDVRRPRRARGGGLGRAG